MAEKKNLTRSKKPSVIGDDVITTISKNKPFHDIDDLAPAVAVEEKEADILAPEIEETEDEDMAEDEIDPFGDKWEE